MNTIMHTHNSQDMHSWFAYTHNTHTKNLSGISVSASSYYYFEVLKST